MQITPEQKKEYSQIFTDVWNLAKKYFNGEESDQYWSDLTDEANELAKKYNNDKFCEEIIRGCVNGIERRWLSEQKERLP